VLSNSTRGGTLGKLTRWIILILLTGCIFLLYATMSIFPVKGDGIENSRNLIRWQAEQEQLARQSLSVHFFGTWHGLSDQDRVEMVGKKLFASPMVARTTVPIRFKILSAPHISNAFILPGGQIYITSGLLHRLQSEGELAGVLSHEIAHLIAGNTDDQITRNQAIYSQDQVDVEKPGVGISTKQLQDLELSRENEFQADLLGICILHQAGYDPVDFLQVLQVLAKENGEEQSLPEYLRSHPGHDSRIEKIKEAIENIDLCLQ
jgi:beta-barrel assembly-enhancing protease